jgi:hypothetical protein
MALPVMVIMLAIFTGSIIGDCMDVDACRAAERDAMIWLWLTPFAGLAIFFLARWAMNRQIKP